GIVERSHRIDGERFYSRHLFKSEEDLKKNIADIIQDTTI
ncbi:hypothetical protein SAMN04489868_1431, partial [Pisciglobus halotolerans]